VHLLFVLHRDGPIAEVWLRKSSGREIGELLIGEFREDGQVYFIKRLIAGLNAFNRQQIYDAVQDLKVKKTPFVNLPERASEHQHGVTEEAMQKCIWLKPELWSAGQSARKRIKSQQESEKILAGLLTLQRNIKREDIRRGAARTAAQFLSGTP
jgi:hypothetical protein